MNEVFGANPLSPSSGPVVELERSRLLAQKVGDALRQEGDVRCAELLQAALELSRGLPDDDPGPINRFLCSTAQIFINETTDSFRLQLEKVLLGLSQRRWYGREQPPLTY
ncbi:hypothetical protein B0H66DRAFT_534002 [Apodospora peruviana]|uniref:Uncharacterized protein n=1 Tax=Apodospora peruviana TaxID=516989 RepID=A0AAE0I077_9PEZI|nr:hypothetical protein B0H66DRAFT_534002 [Apodospora peruviana]